ncbi:MAG: vWA domain-containing protein [Myxococcota bacterium]
MYNALRVLTILASLTVACSSDDGSGVSIGSSGAGGQTVMLPGGGTSSSSGGSSNASFGGGDACSPNNSSACIGQQFEGESLPLDIYIMFDQSGSMCSCVDPPGSLTCPDAACRKTRMDAVREATDQFLADPASAGIGVGLGFFGKQAIGSADCRVDTYATPAVAIAALPGNASAIMTALRAAKPTGETPTGAALRGACNYARDAKQRTGRQVVILLLTDGKPEAPVSCPSKGECCPTLDDAAQAARECASTQPFVNTYVLGVGPLLGNLEQIAIAGGTKQAYLVEGSDVARDVLAALNRIRGDAAIPCQLELPPAPSGQKLDLAKVNIQYADSSCRGTSFYYVESAAACSDHTGWYYDNASAPTRVELCPRSCDVVSAPGGRLYYTIGCATETVPR